jgi:hypothetical protein
MSIAGPIVAFETASAPRASVLNQVRRIAVRIAHAIAEANDRRAKREIARFVALNGGFFTDEVERRIGERINRF